MQKGCCRDTIRTAILGDLRFLVIEKTTKRTSVVIRVDRTEKRLKYRLLIVSLFRAPVRVSVRRDETEATDNAERLVLGALVLQLGCLLPLLAVALLVAETISTYPYVIHLLLLHDRDVVRIALRRRESAGRQRQNNQDLRREIGQENLVGKRALYD